MTMGKALRRRRDPLRQLRRHARGLPGDVRQSVHAHHDLRRQPAGHRRRRSARCTPPSRRTSPGRRPRRASTSRTSVAELAAEYPDLFEEVRGLGVLIGMQFASADIGYAVRRACSARGVLVGGTLFNAKTLRMRAAGRHHLRAAGRGARAPGRRSLADVRKEHERRPAGRPLTPRGARGARRRGRRGRGD